MKKSGFAIMILNSIFIFSWVSCSFAPGSYPYAEKYEIGCGESDLANVIKLFKDENPEYRVPVQSQLKDGRRDENDHWYHVYFYYSKDNEIVKTWIRESGRGTTTFALVAINEGLTIGKWKDLNKGYSKKESLLQKEKFEQLILNEIESKIALRSKKAAPFR